MHVENVQFTGRIYPTGRLNSTNVCFVKYVKSAFLAFQKVIFTNKIRMKRAY